MSRDRPTVSVIVPSRDRVDDLRCCLTGVLRQDWPAVDVIVVDDASSDGTAAMVRREFPSAALLRFEDPVGASTARNAALVRARGEVVWFLDSDSEPTTPDCLRRLVGVIAGDASIGSAGGEICRRQGQDSALAPTLTLPRQGGAEDGGDLVVRIKRVRINGETASTDVPLDPRMLEDTDYLPTCNLLARRDLVVDLGGFDPVYVVLSEDKELGWRIRRRGLRNVLVGSAPVVHHVSRRARTGDLVRKLRNTTRFAIINLPCWRVLLLPLLDLVCLFNRGKLKALRSGGVSVTKHLSGGAAGIVARKRTPTIVKLLLVGPKYLACLLAAYAWNLYHLIGALRMRWHRPNFVEQASDLVSSVSGQGD